MLNWEQLDPIRVERAIKVLLLKRSPGVQALDGAGGDGGKDAQLVTRDGRTVFEIKSFGRLNSSRRRQVEKSLRQAVRSAPDMNRWVLIIPMDMTPARPGTCGSEEVWFHDKLAAIAPGVDLAWWGRDWLDLQAAENADIRRYVEGDHAQVLELAKELGQEVAVLARGGRHER